jgi:DNA helicase II / ATP-dependent DNA helicase PcrA
MPQLNPEQKQAIEHSAGPLLIIAGAGTGKTFVITQRILHLINKGIAKTSEILALTFTQKAAQEMEERVDIAMPYGYEPIQISTFHSFADTILRQEATFIGLDGNYKLMTSAEAYLLFRQNLYQLPLEYFRPPGNPTKYIRDILSHFSRLKDEDISPDDYDKFVASKKKEVAKIKDKDLLVEESDKFAQYTELAKVYRAYEDLKHKKSKLDFGDVITEVLRLFRTRRSLLAKYQKKYRFVLVDEYQDTNYAQNELVYLLAGEECNITVVGDDDQSIYKFRGAAISNILQFKERFGRLSPSAEKDGRAIQKGVYGQKEVGKGKGKIAKKEISTVVLTRNYRSYQAILDASYKLVQHNNPDRLEISESVDKRLTSEREDTNKNAERTRVLHGEREMDELDLVVHNILTLVGREKESPVPDKSDVLVQETDTNLKNTPGGIGGQLGFNAFSDEPYQGKYTYKDIAILVRAHSHADEIANTLKYFKIPYQFVGPRGLYSQEEIKDLISFLQLVNNYTSDLDLIRLLRLNFFEIGVRETIELLRINKLRRESIIETLEYLLDKKLGFDRDAEISELPPKEDGIKTIFSAKSVKKLDHLLGILDKAFGMRQKGRSVGDILYMFLEDSGYIKLLAKDDSAEIQSKAQNISMFFEVIKEFERESASLDISEFIDYLDYSLEIGDNPDVSNILDAPDRNAVNILTVHGSKGLEFPVVFMINLIQNRFPSTNRTDVIPIADELVKEVLPMGDEHTQEERRLFYVGMTRAKDYLFMSYADFYGDGKMKRKPSRFLLEAMGGEINKEYFYTRPKDLSAINYGVVEKEGYDLPPEVVGQLAKQVSYSQIETYKTCPLKYKYAYVLKIPTPESATLSYGKSMHNTLKSYYDLVRKHKDGLPGIQEEPSLDLLLEIYDQKWIGKGYESKAQELKRYKRGKQILKDFYSEFINASDNPIMLEQGFKIGSGDNGDNGETKFSVSGFIDRVDEIEGGVEIIDYKTGKVQSQKDIKKNPQLSLYAVGLEQAFGLKVKRVSLLFIDELKKVSIEPDKALLDNLMKDFSKVVEKIRRAEFAPTPSPFVCKFCDYRKICPFAMA